VGLWFRSSDELVRCGRVVEQFARCKHCEGFRLLHGREWT
jgi:hypothetical protein